MSSVSLRVVSVAGVACFALAGCEEGPGAASVTDASVSTAVPAPQTVVKEVERADIFSATEPALWDGRPSLGGVWVAHPDVVDPERVRIRNTTNGQTITGALFRRERSNPGPRIQVSSEAAAALAILAGQPTELEVVVLRTEEIEIAPAPLPESEIEAGEEGGDTPDVSTEAAAEIADGLVVAVPAVATATVGDDAEPQPKQKGFWARFRDSLRNDPAPAVEEIGSTTVLTETATDASTPDVETARLDPIVAAEAAIEEAEAESEDASPLPTRQTEIAAVSATAPAAGLKNPYIQIGLFGEESNASAASSNLRQAGIVPTVAEGKNGNGPFWRVLVGPVTTAEDQAELLDQVRALGYADAYLTSE